MTGLDTLNKMLSTIEGSNNSAIISSNSYVNVYEPGFAIYNSLNQRLSNGDYNYIKSQIEGHGGYLPAK